MRIGIDLGGTKIAAVALSAAGEEIARRRVTTPRDYVASLEAIAPDYLAPTAINSRFDKLRSQTAR